MSSTMGAMDPRDEALARRIRLGEDSELELKRAVFAGKKLSGPARDDVADELAAFANGLGGTLVIGVDDKTREIIGIPLEHLDLVERWLRETCNDSVKPSLDIHIRKVELDDTSGVTRVVVRIDVPRSLFVHRSPGGYFRRFGSSKREMAPDVLARLFQERSQSRVIRFDESPVPGTSPKDVDPDLARRFTREDAAPSEVSLRKLRILADDDGGNVRVTVAGVLMCAREPGLWLPHAQIQAVSYLSADRDAKFQADARDITGPLDQQVRDSLHFLRRNMFIRATKVTARTEFPQFSERAVFEALVNAVAHRDYSMAGARVRMHMFADRLELYVPGALANTLTPDSMHLRQYNRNELIVSLLARCPTSDDQIGRAFLMDRRGEGVPIILEQSERLSGRAPEYTLIDQSELRLVIWAAPDPHAAS